MTKNADGSNNPREWYVRELTRGTRENKGAQDPMLVDVLVTFSPDARHSLFDSVHMENELREIFGRKADLVERVTLRNPYRRAEILKTAQLIYVA